jgi:hypothetical protein
MFVFNIGPRLLYHILKLYDNFKNGISIYNNLVKGNITIKNIDIMHIHYIRVIMLPFFNYRNCDILHPTNNTCLYIDVSRHSNMSKYIQVETGISGRREYRFLNDHIYDIKYKNMAPHVIYIVKVPKISILG